MTTPTTTSTPSAAPSGPDERADPDRIYHVDPATLVFGPNARTEWPDDPEFVESIRQRGVLQPITAYYDELAQLVVHIGQRRARFAVGHLETIPIRIVDRPADADLLLDQLVENDHRTPLRTAERAAALGQLAAFGLSAAAIARRAGYRRADVDAALTVARSHAAAAVAEDLPAITLDQAAAVAEFDEDPEVVEALTAAASQGRGFDHVVQRARDDRRDATERADAASALIAKGYTVLPERPPWKGPAKHLPELGVTEAEHRGCPGQAVYLSQRWDGPQRTWHPVWVCTDARTHHPRQLAIPDEDVERERQRRAELNRRGREWRSAESVRRAWLRSFAHRRTAPAGAEAFIAACLLRGDTALAQAMLSESRHRLLRQVLGLDADDATADTIREQIDGLVEQIGAGTPRRAILLTTALLLAAWDDSTGTHTWRAPTSVDRCYLRQMIAWGYEPSEVERILVEDGADA